MNSVVNYYDFMAGEELFDYFGGTAYNGCNLLLEEHGYGNN